ncbi:hypothetical protein JB92DRAFT_3121325 [Gautieria morchelliformis]|nr:hypothetical protein JB92DRAFT_3121325 [Gautieria morchelliformis]
MSSHPSVLAEKTKSKKKHRDKGKSKEKVIASTAGEHHGRNEGVDPNRATYGMAVLDTSQVDEEFDWDLLKDDENKELWILRVPEGFKTKLLDELEIQPPLKNPGAKLSSFERKRAKYDIWSVGHSNHTVEPNADARASRGEEIKGLSCLLPRKKKHGKFYLAPKQIAQHVVITHSPALPNVDNLAVPTPSTRYSVPKHLLKHHFKPFGALSTTKSIEHPATAMDVDALNVTGGRGEGGHEEAIVPRPIDQARTPSKNYGRQQEIIGTKRKNIGDSETPKHKSKKLKV